MPTFFVRYDVVECWKGTFRADSLEHAQYLLAQVEDDEINIDELPNAYWRNMSINVELYKGDLEQLPERTA
jgi:hypothetical protein